MYENSFDEVYRCGRCGFCLKTCPVYQNTLRETASPRGKVQLIRNHAGTKLDGSAYLGSLVSCCLMCGTCTANCPSGVRHDIIFMKMRSRMSKIHGRHWYEKVLFHFLSHEDQLRIASKFARIGRVPPLERFVDDVKVGNIPIRRLPKFNSRPFLGRMKGSKAALGGDRGTVLYFTGCATNYVFEAVGRAVVSVLTRMGYRVEIPDSQVCCGLPLFSHGAMDMAADNILKNIDIFNREDIVAVVVDCATCGSALKKEYPIVLETLGMKVENALSLSEKVFDISEFIGLHFDALKPHLPATPKKQTTVTYHSPCHLRNHQEVSVQIEDLLNDLPGVNYVRSDDAESCCGGGGTFFYDFPEGSKKIVDVKIANAVKTGAKVWATGCPSCRTNLSGNLSGEEGIHVLHPVELLASIIAWDE